MLKYAKIEESKWICDLCGEEIEDKELVRVLVSYGYDFERVEKDVHRACFKKLTLANLSPKGVTLSE